MTLATPPTLPPDALARLIAFQGYGNLAGPLWFTGIEESTSGGHDPATVARNLHVRATQYAPVMALHERWDLLPAPPSGRVRRASQVTLWMAKFARALADAPDWADLKAARHVVLTQLCRADGGTFLTNLLPLPARNTSTWPHTSLFPTRRAYTSAVLPARVAQLRALLTTHRPRVVLAFSWALRAHTQSLLPDDTVWARLPTREPVLAAEHDGTQLLITPFFGNGRMSAADAQHIIDHLRATVRPWPLPTLPQPGPQESDQS